MFKFAVICLTVSALALATLIIAAAGQRSYFRGTTPEMLEAYSTPAQVLAADADGAITQTGNGVVAGYSRGETKPSWQFKFTRFPLELMDDFDNPDDAQAWCAGRCPSALVLLRGHYSKRGAGTGALAETLAKSLTALGSGYRLLDLIDARRALVGPVSGADRTSSRASLMLVNGSRTERLPTPSPSAAYASSNGFRVVAGSADGNTGTLTRAIRAGGRWRPVGSSIVEPNLENLCISADGRWVGAISRRIQLLPFLGGEAALAGNPLSGGVCRADSRGYTVVVNPAASPGQIGAVRMTHDGRRIWARSFGTRRLISPGPSPLIVTESTRPQRTIVAVDATTGQERLRRGISTTPKVGEDGAIVVADRTGQPIWITLRR
jgi:hypothetical protein